MRTYLKSVEDLGLLGKKPNSATQTTEESFTKTYFRSDEWHALKKKAKRLMKVCTVCCEGSDLNVYILDYKKLGEDSTDHLVLLCRSCLYDVLKVKKSKWVSFSKAIGLVQGLPKAEFKTEVLRPTQAHEIWFESKGRTPKKLRKSHMVSLKRR